VVSDLSQLRQEVAALDWYHSIDLGHGIVTPGTPVNHAMIRHGLPELSGRSVLDIGAWDGFYSFVAEQRGARRVVALDHYAWLVDLAERNRYWAECDALGKLPDPGRDLADFAHPETMPGRRGFDLAHRVLQSRVEPVLGDFMEVDPEVLGHFDVVLFLGVLYHLRDPLVALEHVRALTKEVAVIETEAIGVLGMPEASLLSFTPGAELRGDHTNWFVPTRAALHGLCRAAGFARVETRIGPPAAAVRLRHSLRRGWELARPDDTARHRHRARGRVRSGVSELPLHRYRITVHASA
jgi:tRNA (mo5U34)-methyltransferase